MLLPRVATACLLALTLTACGGDSSSDPAPAPSDSATTPSVDADQKDALAAFDAFWDESVAIANAGVVPKDAFASTANGPYREQMVAQLTQQAEEGTTRRGAPKFKDEKATVDGDTALVVTCINQDGWGLVPKGGEEVAPSAGWTQLGRTLTKFEGVWYVTGASIESTKETCP